VENESLRKELEEKQELLCQASKAMELMDEQQKELHEKYQTITDELNRKIEILNVSYNQL
jgi:centrosomin